MAKAIRDIKDVKEIKEIRPIRDRTTHQATPKAAGANPSPEHLLASANPWN